MERVVVEMKLDDPKKGSVLYKSEDPEPAARNIYVMKQALGFPYPNKIRVTIEEVVGE